MSAPSSKSVRDLLLLAQTLLAEGHVVEASEIVEQASLRSETIPPNERQACLAMLEHLITGFEQEREDLSAAQRELVTERKAVEAYALTSED